MYRTGTCTNITANHFLFGADFGVENLPHSHDYRIEVQLSSESLDQFGFVFDISMLENLLLSEKEYFEHRLLNDLPEFSGLNPTVEAFAKIIHTRLGSALRFFEGTMKVIVWENDQAWASFN